VIRYEDEERRDGSKTALQGSVDQQNSVEVKGATGRRRLTRGVSQLEEVSLLRPGSFWQFAQGQGLPPSAVVANISRYESDFEELELLGKGAFGAVFRARNRLDGRDYAIKKIRLSPSAGNDEKTLREISALSRLSHQHIVRYVTCWIQTQEEKDSVESSSGDMMTSSKSLQASARDFLLPGINDDFLSVGHDAFSKAGQNIRFANSEDDSESDEEEQKVQSKASDANGEESSDSESTDSESRSDSKWQSSKASKSRKSAEKSQSQSAASKQETVLSPRWLFIQMEYVENQTLREAIDRGLSVDDCWRLFRQMVEALAHVASLGIIHRDLKPSNVLMLGGGINEDGDFTAGDIKIGDFGLATTTPQQQVTQEGVAGYGTAEESADLTTEIGTNLYIAPEMDKAGSRYDYKVDIYAIGIIFFEMLASQRVYKTGMERISVLRDLRSADVCLPKGWNEAQMTAQTKVIRALLSHDPAARPSPLDLLKSELLPPKMEDEYIAECLRLLSNPNSTYNLQLMDSLFSRTDDFEQNEARDFTFDSGSNADEGQSLDNRFIGVACQHLRALFHRRGAVELEAPLMIPPNELYNEDQKPVELLDKTGKVVQLPYDLVVPFARMVARAENQRFKRYAIAPVYRNNLLAGGQPRSVLEVDYDIVAPEKTAAAEGEILSVVDEILDDMPGFDSSEWVIQISHAHILDLLLERIPSKHRREALQAIGTLTSGSKTAISDMRSRLNHLGMGIPRSVIDEIEVANLSEEVEIVSEKLHRLVALDLLPKLSRAVEEIQEVIEAARHFGVQRRILLTPLLITNRSFYKDNVFFVVARLRGKRRDILASGGRYDALLKRFTNPALTRPAAHAVGIQIGLGRIALALAKQQEVASASDRMPSAFTPSRCDVYVAASGLNLLSLRMEICRELWAANISADLAYEHAVEDNSVELLASTCKAEGILFLVIARARHSSMVKVKSIFERGEYEVNRWELSAWLGDRISRIRGSSGIIDVSTAAEKSGTNNSMIPTLNPLEAEVLLPERYATDKRKIDRHGNNDRRIKKHLAPIQENSIRQVSKAIEDYNSTTSSASNNKAVIIAVDFALFFTFQRLCSAAMAKTDEGMWKLFMECFTLPEEREYARAIRRRIEELESGRAWLVSIRHEGSAFLV
jgi:translation initiation factor 2-alpha kinase 4